MEKLIGVLYQVPTDGSTNQWLKKTGSGATEYDWATIYQVPTDGSSGQWLKKIGGGATEYAWATIPDAPTPPTYEEIPAKGIIMFNDVIGNAPNGFVACDGTNGTNGTPDLSAETVLHIMRSS